MNESKELLIRIGMPTLKGNPEAELLILMLTGNG